MEHSRQLDVGGVSRGAGDLLDRVHAGDALPDDVQLRVVAPRLRVARRQLDDLRLLATLDLDLGRDEALSHSRARVSAAASTARTIFG